jgi:hypothetical protein
MAFASLAALGAITDWNVDPRSLRSNSGRADPGCRKMGRAKGGIRNRRRGKSEKFSRRARGGEDVEDRAETVMEYR